MLDRIETEIDAIDLGDERLDKRAKQVIGEIYANIGEGLAASFNGPEEIKAAYRLFSSNLTNPEKILKPHTEQALERVRQYPVVGFVQDTTDIDMKHMSHVEGLGVLNDTERPGCSLHPVVAFTPDKLCLGIFDANFIIRDPETLGKKESNNSRNIEEKESYRWIEGYNVVCGIAKQCPETVCVCIGDRESDIYELFLSYDGKTHFLVRGWHNRYTEKSEDSKVTEDEVPKGIELPSLENFDTFSENTPIYEEINRLKKENNDLAKENEKLRKRKNSKIRPEIVEARKKNSEMIAANRALISELYKQLKHEKTKKDYDENKFKQQLSTAPIYGNVEFELKGRDGKKSRIVKQIVRAKTVTFLPSRHKRHLPIITVNAVLLEEVDVPEGEEPICWILLTSLPIRNFDEIQLIIDLYLSRWGIELFFKVLKSGCKIEELRFQQASRLFVCIALYMIVAWRILYATFIGRVCPHLSCSMLFEKDEWQSVYAVMKRAKPPEVAPTLEEFMKMIATLGGYRGRKSDGPPGMKKIWTGIQAMHSLAEGWRAHRLFN